jgi:hypothetical protein
MALSSYNVQLKWGNAEGSLTKKIDIKDFPDLIGDPNLLETTTLSDASQTYIPGIRSVDLLTFTFNLDKTSGKAVKEDEGKELFYELALSDGTTFSWKGSHTLGVPGKGVDEVLEGTINIAPATEIEVTFAE